MVEDPGFAGQMEHMYLHDLSNAREIVLHARHRKPVETSKRTIIGQNRKGGSAGRTAAGVMRLGHAVGAALTNRRDLGPAEAIIMWWGAALLATFGGVVAYWPRAAAVPAAVLSLWIAISLAIRAYKLKR